MRSKFPFICAFLLTVLLAGCGADAAGPAPAESPAAGSYLSIDELDITACVATLTCRGLSAERADTDLMEDEFEYGLQLFLSQYAATPQITDRPVEAGDTVGLDYIATSGESLVTDFWQDGAELTVGAGATFAAFEDALVGRTCGEDFSVDLVLPESISAEYGGKTVQVLVTVHYIKGEPVLPELTDEFAASLEDWDCATAEEFRQALRGYLAETKAAYYENEYQDALWRQVLDSAVLTEEGEAFVDSLCQRRLEEYEAYIQSAGMTMDAAAASYGYDGEAALAAAVEAAAGQEARELLAMHYIAETEGLSYTDEEYYAAVADYAASLGFSGTAELIGEYGVDAVEETVGNALLYGLARQFVADNAA